MSEGSDVIGEVIGISRYFTYSRAISGGRLTSSRRDVKCIRSCRWCCYIIGLLLLFEKLNGVNLEQMEKYLKKNPGFKKLLGFIFLLFLLSFDSSSFSKFSKFLHVTQYLLIFSRCYRFAN